MVPKNLTELFDQLLKEADSFGYKNDGNAILRNCITDKSGLKSITKDNVSNFWMGFIREDQPTSGVYDGLSYVIFPEHDGTHCVVSIGIGSGSIGKDGDLAASPGFRRSFMRLINKGKSDAVFFFKMRFDEMETSTPGLQEELFSDSKSYEEVMVSTTTKYNADSNNTDAPGMLPAAFIVDYSTQDGWNLVKGWLAQYAKWRNWDKYKNGADKKKKTESIKNAIAVCILPRECPDADSIYGTLKDQKYVVLQGAPGCGKTWNTNEVAEKYFSPENDKVIFTQFHAETTYSDFVYGIRPTLNGNNVAYKGEKGVLLKAIEEAEVRKEKGKVLLIIDEINRANLANVLGPVFYLFEPSAGREHELDLGVVYNEKSKVEEHIMLKELPDNLYVLATMNTADKSLAVVDFALRRRFAWVTLRPHKLSDTVAPDFDSDFYDEVDELFSIYATDDELNLQPGQSYFMNKNKRKETILYGLMPLLKEYFSEGFLQGAKEDFSQLFLRETNVFMYE